jgi:alcohol dehydrogenase YqhD (iron-dependent ADH family)
MDNFEFYFPTHFIFGRETENGVGGQIKRHGGSRVLIHYGGGSAEKSGLLSRVRASLESEGLTYVELGGVKPNPRDTLVYEGIDLCRKENVDFVLAVGGGSVIDSAKMVAGGTVYDGDFWDFFTGKARAASGLPIGVILTLPAAGSEGTCGSMITKEEGLLKRPGGGPGLYPKFAIMNPELTMTLPAYQTASGATDIMAHILERYFTNTKDVELTDRIAEALLLTLVQEVPKAMADPNDYGARANIMWAGTLAHNNLAGTGKTQDWNSHAIEHELSALYDCAHGAGLAVVMPAWMQYVMHHDIPRFARLAVNVWGVEPDEKNPEKTAAEGIEAFKTFLRSIGMPVTLTELGADEADIARLIEMLRWSEEGVGGFVPLTIGDVEKIYDLAK